MRTRDKLLLGLVAGTGAAWGARAWLRARRRITLDDKVVIITGASSGHGLFVARYAIRHGARVVLAARDVAELHAAGVELEELGARDILVVPADVRDPLSCRNLIARTIEHHGRVDILVNNAGIIQVGPMEAMTREDYEAAMATNYWGAFNCIMAVLPHMRERGFGRIANVVSVGGKMPVPHLLPYLTSKFALTGLTKGLRVELAKDGILVTGVYPSTMRTGGHTHAWFKGNERAEYLWFALGDTIPLVATSAEAVARALWRGVCNGDAEVDVGWQTNINATLDALFPNWSAEILSLVARGMPDAPGPQPEPVRGHEVDGHVANLLTAAVPPGARPEGAG